MATVKVIPPRAERPKILRVAAYCRVSSDSSDQLHSYATQIKAYTDLIRQHNDWELADIYADEGLTGTRMDKREDFQRMMADCRKGRIDRILVKSISRFARNTRDCLSALRELSSLGVTVLFEEDHIDTEMLTTELMVSVSGALAQQESISISQNQRISYQRRMEKGEFITCSRPFGYRLVDGKHLEIVESEAKWVRWIFKQYISGTSSAQIAEQLEMKKVSNKAGIPVWWPQSVRCILENEKYIGDSLVQKTYTEVFPFKERKNTGERCQYYIENTHPAIISKALFDQARALRQKRSHSSKHSQTIYPLQRKVVCGICGSGFKRRVTKNGYVSWVCGKHNDRASQCPQDRVSEDEIYMAFVRMYGKLKHRHDEILRPVFKQLDLLSNRVNRERTDILEINEEIAQLSEKSYRVTQLHSGGLLPEDVFIHKQTELQASLMELHAKRRNLLKNDQIENLSEQLTRISNVILSGPDSLRDFDESLFSELVQKVTIDGPKIMFQLYSGITLTEERREPDV